jgi:hypothetical protein
MILEYTELPLFKKLFDWQSSQNGSPAQIGELEDMCHEKLYTEVKVDFEDKGHKDWHKEKVFKWLNAEPELKNVDLRDYFWISRDKISTSIAGSSLVSPIVKAIYKELENELPATLSKKIIVEKIVPLAEYERVALLELLSQTIKKNPKTKRFYDLFHYMIDVNVPDAAIYYRESLKSISVTDIEPGVAVAQKQYTSNTDLGDFLNNYYKGSNTPGAKAFKLKNP